MRHLFVLIFLYISVLLILFSIWKQFPSPEVKFIFCDVGQGDATLISSGSIQLLVDAGPDESVLRCLGRNIPFWDRTIEYAVMTHTDLDHYGGFSSVLRQYTVNQFFLPAFPEESQQFKDLFALLNRKDTQLDSLQRADVLSLNTAIELSVLHPEPVFSENMQSLAWWSPKSERLLQDVIETQAGEEIDKNESSIVLFLRHGNIDVLLTGDIGAETELTLVERGLLEETKITKIAHHGSKHSTSDTFIKKNRPEVAIISCGLNNQFSHPAAEVLIRLEGIGAAIHRTDSEGELRIASNGESYWFY